MEIDLYKILENMTYNQVVDKLIATQIQNDDENIKGTLLKYFLEENATQMTKYGINSLKNELYENCNCVLFHNNHFSTITKHNVIN